MGPVDRGIGRLGGKASPFSLMPFGHTLLWAGVIGSFRPWHSSLVVIQPLTGRISDRDDFPAGHLVAQCGKALSPRWVFIRLLPVTLCRFLIEFRLPY